MTFGFVSLLRKEMRQLLPILVLWFAILFMGYISLLATIRLDEHSFALWCSEFCAPGLNPEAMSSVVLIMVLFMITAYSLYPREHDESTIDFLRALPVRRLTVFVAKFAAAWMSLCIVLLISHAVDTALLALNSQSVNGRAYHDVTVLFLLRDCLFAYVILCHGIFLSRFRLPGLVLYAVYLIGLLWWENALGSTGAFNLFSFYRNEYIGSTLILNWHTIIWQLVAATIILLLAYGLWSRAESSSVGEGGTQRSRGWGIVASVIAFAVLSAAMAGRFLSDTAMGERILTSSARYDFIARPESQPTVDALVVTADADYDALAALLDTEEQPHIVADLTATKEHIGGLAVWKKIQMDISDGETDEYYRRVLSHETVHVFQSVLAQRKLSRANNSTAFFLEGMAQAVSFYLTPDDSQRQSNWIVAGLAWRRHEIRFADLIDNASFVARFDPELVYTLADTWIDALTAVCGMPVLGKILRAAAGQGAAIGQSGEVFWRYVLRQSGCELEAVNIAWAESMDALLPEAEDRYPRFGSVRFTRSSVSGSVMVTVDVKTDESQAELLKEQQFYLRVKADDRLVEDISPLIRGDLVGEAGAYQASFQVTAASISGLRVRYQIGFRPSSGARLFFERWQSAGILDL